MFEVLIAFERCLRSAMLGHSVRLQDAGEARPAEFLALVGDLTQALLSPNSYDTCLINYFRHDFVIDFPDVKPDYFGDAVYHELPPMVRAKVLCAIISIISSEEISLLFCGRYWALYESRTKARTLEWLYDNAAGRIKAMLVRGSARWPVRLRKRMRALHED